MAQHLPTAYLNGRFLPLADATISPLDRGFLFGEGVYEVIAVYAGEPFHLDAHLQRLTRSCALLDLTPAASVQEIGGIVERLIDANGGGDQSVYLQLTRGVSESARNHLYPKRATPTVFVMCQTLDDRDGKVAREGVRAITMADARWAQCQIKATSLLANTIARQAADEAGAVEAILIRDGHLTEGAASTVFVVRAGSVTLPPAQSGILPGTTAIVVGDLLALDGVELRRAPLAADTLSDADEIWLASTTRGVLPVCRLDGAPVGDGVPGPLWQALDRRYRVAIGKAGAAS